MKEAADLLIKSADKVRTLILAKIDIVGFANQAFVKYVSSFAKGLKQLDLYGSVYSCEQLRSKWGGRRKASFDQNAR